MKYVFYSRNVEPYSVEEYASFTITPGKPADWFGTPENIHRVKHMMGNLIAHGEKFDIENPEHLEELPVLVSGSLFWVVKEEEKNG